jgi:hypothetical protein
MKRQSIQRKGCKVAIFANSSFAVNTQMKQEESGIPDGTREDEVDEIYREADHL